MRASLILAVGLASILSAKAETPDVFVAKSKAYIQATSAGPVLRNDGTAYRFRGGGAGLADFEPISNPQIRFPDTSVHTLPKLAPGEYVITNTFSTEAANTTAFPNGRYQFSASLNFIGTAKAHVDLQTGTYPTAPKINNFDQIKNADGTAEITLRWDAFADAQSDDLISLKIVDDSSGDVVEDADSIDPSITDWTLSSDTLQNGKSYTATLTFLRVKTTTPDADEILPGRSLYNAETAFTIVAAGIPPVTDTMPPTLSSVSPTNNTVMMSIYSPVLFQFSEAMDTTKSSIEWHWFVNGQEQTLNLADFHQFWSDDRTTLIISFGTGAAWPSGYSVNWTLNPSPGAAGNFSDRAGNELPKTSGTFITAGGVPPCFAPAPGGLPGSLFGVFKRLNYLQTNADLAILDPVLAAQAYAYFKLPESTSVQTLVTLKVPTDNQFQFKLKPLTPPQNATNLVFRDFQEPFAGRSDLDVEYPGGTTYAMELRNTSAQVTNSVSLTIPATGYPPIPHILNFDAAQTIATNANFTLQWEGFTAFTGGEFVTFNVYDAHTNLVFQAPDSCDGIALDPTATSVVVPANLLAGNSNYTAELSLSRITDSNKTLTGLAGSGFAALTRVVRFPLKTTGSSVTLIAPQFQTIQGSGSGKISLTIASMPGRKLVLEVAASLAASLQFSPLVTTNPPGTSVTLEVPALGAGQVFRAQQQ